MTDLNKWERKTFPQLMDDYLNHWGLRGGSFVRSNGTMVARIYERLTKASRRRTDGSYNSVDESYYRQGVYDTLKALKTELE